ncbi:tRNA 2-selenouridine(34) synthase MnmH [Undibacterium sp. TS12]|uniref:tRNA 2-selenouridine(34) synthase MnmH n=1 Tax=Undibacterium sp. TS12 TaxID=2908202 RepID=UPI001F4D016E|nr:tRNA 2-selenouridine(34) synthase MnmH [Undibacterium sp. TS12]MCH8621668.1 tRNA 2-selenouridine(34) synthase MnmH [Undibacterium sp. TS12]
MKYPELLDFSDVLLRRSEFDTIIDVRSQAEFAEDHIIGAINCPVLNDEERIVIGTMYKQIGSFEAKRLGAALVAKNIGSHIESMFQDKPRDWKPLIYCWRGGNRSGSMAHIFARIGWPVAQLNGGYKAYRQHVNQSLESVQNRFQWQVLCGPTGSGKSRILQTLVSLGAQVLDLEQLAVHRGSVLGNIPEQAQPSQKQFESRIYECLQSFNTQQPVYVEAESKKIGNLRVPENLMTAMRASPCVTIHLPTEQRVALLMNEYAHFMENTHQLIQQLHFLISLHGKEKISHWKTLTESGEIKQLVSELLRQHYDPAYSKSITRNFTHYTDAMMVEQTGIDEADFIDSARMILQNGTHPAT